MLSKLINGLRALLRKSEVERELDEEMQFHLEKEMERNIRRGMSPVEARMAALTGRDLPHPAKLMGQKGASSC